MRIPHLGIDKFICATIARYRDETSTSEPHTWEEFADFVEYFHGEDLNGDGESDYGICSLNGAGPGGPQGLLMQIAASKLQYLGASQARSCSTIDVHFLVA